MKTATKVLVLLQLFLNAKTIKSTDEKNTKFQDLSILQKARCVVPNGVNHVTRAVLLQQCLSRDYAQGNETICYEELGCFQMDSPWTSILRPFPTPKSPSFIDVHLFLYTRLSNSGYDVPLWPEVQLEGTDFNPNRTKTVFITHGFASSTNSSWMSDLKDAYLKHIDANVFLVDWGKGAQLTNYLQVASNTRIVGAELARFIQNVTSGFSLDPSNIHLMGHSLGAQISAYCAKKVHGIGKLTALDPAQPGFEGTPAEVRLAKGDATFIDVIHTSARPFLPTLGFGMISSVGDVDFYMNGGLVQPGCKLPNITAIPKLTAISDLATIPVEVLADWVKCSHGRSYEYFISALTTNCTFLGRQSGVLGQTIRAGLKALVPVTSSITKCSSSTCIPMNLETEYYAARGIYSIDTKSEYPFCYNSSDGDLKELVENKVKKYTNAINDLGRKVPPLGRLI